MDRPFQDAHALDVPADAERTWSALVHVLPRAFGGRAAERYARWVGCRTTRVDAAFPAVGAGIVGFHVARAEAPRELSLAGEHRFSRYGLSFRLEPGPGGTRVVATTRAEFPGAGGLAYRALVVGSRGHVLVVRRLLSAVARRASAGEAKRPS